MWYHATCRWDAFNLGFVGEDFSNAARDGKAQDLTDKSIDKFDDKLVNQVHNSTDKNIDELVGRLFSGELEAFCFHHTDPGNTTIAIPGYLASPSHRSVNPFLRHEAHGHPKVWRLSIAL
jgi:hypothetical protein